MPLSLIARALRPRRSNPAATSKTTPAPATAATPVVPVCPTCKAFAAEIHSLCHQIDYFMEVSDRDVLEEYLDGLDAYLADHRTEVDDDYVRSLAGEPKNAWGYFWRESDDRDAPSIEALVEDTTTMEFAR